MQAAERLALARPRSHSPSLSLHPRSHTPGLAPQAALGVHVLRRRHKKPRGFESVRQHFGCDGTGLVMVGDRYLTDVTFGNLHGMLTVHTEQLTTVGDNRVAQQMRRVEDWLVTSDPRIFFSVVPVLTTFRARTTTIPACSMRVRL